jgi:hypothetical protein
MILNMFRASLCSSSGGQLYIYSIWYRHILYAAIQCTDQERTESALGLTQNTFANTQNTICCGKIYTLRVLWLLVILQWEF